MAKLPRKKGMNLAAVWNWLYAKYFKSGSLRLKCVKDILELLVYSVPPAL